MTTDGPDPFQRFTVSMTLDYEKWHDGIGYDLDAIAEMGDDDRKRVETLLLSRGISDWRDVEALGALGTERAREALRECARSRRDRIGLRAAEALGEEGAAMLDEDTLIEHIAAAETGGLDSLFDQIENNPTERVKRALLELAHAGPDVVRCHAAAELLFVCGKTSERFDWAERPFFLRFEEPPGPDRDAAKRELAQRAGLSWP